MCVCVWGVGGCGVCVCGGGVSSVCVCVCGGGGGVISCGRSLVDRLY